MQRAPQPQPSVQPRTIVLAVAILVVVVALGFGAYAYANRNDSTPKAKSSTSSTIASKPPPSAKQAKAEFMSCMAQKGIKYSSASADVTHPPAGVSKGAFEAAYKGCVYKLLAGAH